ncbi:MAG TPA: patatin-like phospholipase family protein [Bryobacteraceae bacterium]|nr:patatin-like phospholipase family protein [Bryobacteraceae bacterium]
MASTHSNESTESPSGRPATALVLSGGGFFGAYQAGAWRVISKRFDPDLVVGASIGCINGWLIAGDCSPDEMERYWQELARPRPIPWRWPLPPWRGVVDFSQVDGTLREIHAAFRPRRDYALVLTDLLRLKPVIVRGAEVTWRHLAASCAVPLVFDQVRIGGRFYTDGGLLCANPVWAAAALGACRVIAVNVLDRMPSRILSVGVNAVRGIAPFRPVVPDSVEVTILSPSEELGSAWDTLRPGAGLVRRWMELGAADAERLRDL